MLRRLVFATVVLATSAVSIIACIWIYRAWDARSMQPLEAWHTFTPSEEFRSADYPDGINFSDYQALEARLLNEVERAMSEAAGGNPIGPLNRFDTTSLSYPGDAGQRWNFSFELPVNDPEGSVVLVHGASDAPYSVRALALRLQADRLHVVVVRLPGHGTVPGGLAAVRLEDWTAITAMGVRRAAEAAGPDKPVFVGGYSIGAPLVLDYVLDSVRDEEMIQPAGVFLYSPAISVSEFARFASWDMLLAKLPFFHQFGWTSIQPEYDPYKYNSFPKSAGDLAYRITSRVHEKLNRQKKANDLHQMPPVIAFQSVVDATVNTDALVDGVFRQLPDNGSEIVLFDINRVHMLQHMLVDEESVMLNMLMHGAANRFSATLVSNQSANTLDVAATTRAANSARLDKVSLGMRWPEGVYSLSHVAIPFAPDDPWYGNVPGADGTSTTLGTVAPRGEKFVLLADMSNLMRIRHNPFFEYVAERTLAFRRANGAGDEEREGDR